VLIDSEVLTAAVFRKCCAYGRQPGLDQALDLFLDEARRRSSITTRRWTPPFRSILHGAENRGSRRISYGALPDRGVRSVLEGLQVPYCVASSSDLDRVSFSLSLTGLASAFRSRSIARKWWNAQARTDLFLYAAERMQPAV